MTFLKEHPHFLRRLKLTHGLQNKPSLDTFLLICLPIPDIIWAYLLAFLKEVLPHLFAHSCADRYSSHQPPQATEPSKGNWSVWRCVLSVKGTHRHVIWGINFGSSGISPPGDWIQPCGWSANHSNLHYDDPIKTLDTKASWLGNIPCVLSLINTQRAECLDSTVDGEGKKALCVSAFGWF